MSRRAAPQQEESIYNLIPQPTVAASRPSLYRSKYPHDTPPTASTFGPATASAYPATNLAGDYQMKNTTHRHKQEGAHFGPRTQHYSDPNRFQPASSHPPLPQPTRFEYTTRTKAPLETRHSRDSDVVAARKAAAARAANKNFISENALAVIMAEARRPINKEVDYTKKEDFGKTPAYLEKVKKEIETEKEYIRRVMAAEQAAEQSQQSQTQVLPEEERLALLQQLKTKWAEVNKQYQQTTHLVNLDTMGKIRRKEKYESELQQIEKAIEKLNKPFVFVQAY